MDESNQLEVQRRYIGCLRKANEVLRRASPASELTIGSLQALLLIAETPAQPITWVAQEMKMTISGVQRVLLTLSTTDRTGRPGPGLIQEVTDPRRSNRKLLLLSEKGRMLMTEVLTILIGQKTTQYEVSDVERLAVRQDALHEQKYGITLNAYTSKQIANARRSLQRKGISIGNCITAFPLQPAQPFLSEIKAWLSERGGILHELDDVGKPDGMAVAELPNADEQFAFAMTFRRPPQNED